MIINFEIGIYRDDNFDSTEDVVVHMQAENENEIYERLSVSDIEYLDYIKESDSGD